MKIAVISDTHLTGPTPWFEAVFEKYLAPADALIHCGDHAGFGIWQYLLAHDNYMGVLGNMDEFRLRGELPATRDVQLNGFRLGITHGWGDRSGTPMRVSMSFGPGFDLIIHGHTHQAYVDTIGGNLLMNPGALQRGNGSMAYVYLEPGQEPEVEFVAPKL